MIQCCLVGCSALAEFEIHEDRTDMHPAEGFTYACKSHVGKLLNTVQKDNCPWRWVVASLAMVEAQERGESPTKRQAPPHEALDRLAGKEQGDG